MRSLLCVGEEFCLFFTSIMEAELFQSMTLAEGLKVVLSILKQVMEEQLSSTNVEVAVIKPASDEKGVVCYNLWS